jgi:hypothetical protein
MNMSDPFARAGASRDFTRQRRREALARIAARLRSNPDVLASTLPFDQVVNALGRRGERDLGVMTIPIGSVVGTVDRRPDSFDRSFRPRSPQLRERWERIAAARRRGEPMPPIDVYRVGDLHFVIDGHHRVSVARAFGEATIDARVREVSTALRADADLTTGDLPLKQHERMFHERAPLPSALRSRIELTDEWRYARLADLVEAWGFRASHARGRLLSRPEAALAWFREEYEPVVDALKESGMGGPGMEAERYLRIAMLRYLLLHTHDWSDEVIDQLLDAMQRPGVADDTLVHQILEEMR